MNRTTTVVVALIAAAGLSTMVYAVPEQRALAWGGGFGGCGFGGCGFGGCGFGFGGCGGFLGDPFGCGFGCGGGFFGDGFHKHIIQTIHQVNTCTGDDQQSWNKDNQDQNQKDKNTVCTNSAVNTARHGFGGFGFDGFDH
jgi:hypothetical protein